MGTAASRASHPSEHLRVSRPGCPQVEHPTGRNGRPVPCLQYTPHSLLQRFLFNANQSEQTLHIPRDARAWDPISPGRLGQNGLVGIVLPSTSLLCHIWWRPGGCCSVGLEERRGGDGSSWYPTPQHISSRLTFGDELGAPQRGAQAQRCGAAGDVEQDRRQQHPWKQNSSPAAASDSAVPVIPAPTRELLLPSVPMGTGLREHPEHHRARPQSLGLLQHRRG